MSCIALISTRKGLFTLDAKLQLALNSFAGVHVSMSLASQQHRRWYAALNHGHFGSKLHRSDNAGQSWREVATPCYPRQAEQATEQATGDSLELIWSMEFARPDSDQHLWAGTIPGGLFYSPDAGESWHINPALWSYCQQQKWRGGGYDHAGIHSICPHPEKPESLRVAVSCAGIWQTDDGGTGWENKSAGMRAEYMPPELQYEPIIQDPHRLVQCAAQPEQLWVQHHNGIFRSVDNSESWQELESVKPSAFGFAVAVHPQDANTAWFVPGIKDECRMPVNGRLIVNRTRDGGNSFEALDSGLPQAFSADLVYRHGLDIDASGERLIMGSTTGNLWISDNQGDHWQCLSHYLPPIYAVRFLV